MGNEESALSLWRVLSLIRSLQLWELTLQWLSSRTSVDIFWDHGERGQPSDSLLVRIGSIIFCDESESFILLVLIFLVPVVLLGGVIVYWVLMSNFLYYTGTVVYGESAF